MAFSTPLFCQGEGVRRRRPPRQGVKLVMAGEHRPVVKVDCLPSMTRKAPRTGAMVPAVGLAAHTWGPEGDEEAGVALVLGQDGLPVCAEQD